MKKKNVPANALTVQEARVFNYLNECGEITGLAAYRELGVLSLPSVILSLKKKGVVIHAEYVMKKNRFNEPVRVRRYFLPGC